MSEEQKQSYFRIRTNPLRIRQAASMNLNGYWWIYFIGIFVYYFFFGYIDQYRQPVLPVGIHGHSHVQPAGGNSEVRDHAADSRGAVFLRASDERRF